MKRSPVRQMLMIAALALLLALVYNAFSSKPVPLVRRQAEKAEVPDSVLFSDTSRSPRAAPADTVGPSNTRVIAPLHERALARKDSVAQTGKTETVYSTITLKQLLRLRQGNRGLLLDARNAEEFPKGHIPGARSLPALEIDRHLDEVVTIPRDTIVLIYCNNAECPLGRQLAEFMIAMEFKKVYLYDDGWDGWEKAKMPVEKSE